jgi:TetR/AcrR family transcriptional repressor of nem operon
MTSHILPDENPTKLAIMDIAETLIKQRGYNGFAFREIAERIGIKSASVHYHFPTKGDLAVSIMERYLQRFSFALINIEESANTPLSQLEAFIRIYRNVVKEDKTLTLCMMLGQEKIGLPENVSTTLADLIQMIVQWLTVLSKQLDRTLTAAQAKDQAYMMHAVLQGGILGAMASNDATYFDRAVRQLKRTLNV